jgi:hypothetical protein
VRPGIDIARLVIFWGLMIIAHCYFIRVLQSTRSKPTEPSTHPTENLLDDVLP